MDISSLLFLVVYLVSFFVMTQLYEYYINGFVIRHQCVVAKPNHFGFRLAE